MHKAFRGPGLDTRYWIKIAEVVAVEYNDRGVIAAVETLPERLPMSAIMLTLALGDKEGVYHPVEKGAWVLLLVPDGDPDMPTYALGPLAMGPYRAIEEPKDDNKSIWYKGPGIKAKADVSVEGQVKLGSLDASDPVVLKSKFEQYMNQLHVYLSTGTANGSPVVFSGQWPSVDTGADKVKGK